MEDFMSDTENTPLSLTPLAGWHAAHGARMAPFAGWDMPIQYAGILAEHQHTRVAASVFDICHMGEFLVSGPGAGASLAAAVTHNLSALAPGRCRYGFILTDQGGVADDCIIYCLAADSYMLVANAARARTDAELLRSRLDRGIVFADVSDRTAKIDLQGPLACAALESALGLPARDLAYFAFRATSWQGVDLLISRTGYTGELGYELYLPWDAATALWEALLRDERVRPAGLGARDTLRLEAGLPLYGQDLDERHTPVEAGYAAMLTNPADYAGKEGARRHDQTLIGLRLEGRASARHLDAVSLVSGEPAGVVTSGSFAPSLGCAVAMAWLAKSRDAEPSYRIRTARTDLPAERVPLPFYTGTARKNPA
jgi:aminomethyltransferase